MPDVQSQDSRYIELLILDKSDSPAEETKIGGITDMPNMGPSKETQEDTTLSDKVRSRKVVMEDPANFTLTLLWDPNESPQSQLEDAYNNETKLDLLVRFNDTSPAEEWEMKCIITSYGMPYGGIGSLLNQDFTFQGVPNDQGEAVTHNPSS